MSTYEREQVEAAIREKETKIAELRAEKRSAQDAGDTWRSMQANVQIQLEHPRLGVLQDRARQLVPAGERAGIQTGGQIFQTLQGSDKPRRVENEATLSVSEAEAAHAIGMDPEEFLRRKARRQRG